MYDVLIKKKIAIAIILWWDKGNKTLWGVLLLENSQLPGGKSISTW